MSSVRTPLTRVLAGTAAAALVVGASWFPHASWSWGQSDVDLSTSAHADVGRTAVEDARARTYTVSKGGHARATATSSVLCDGCTGRAASVEVAYVPRGGAVADNVAAAWATGGAGAATAVSVQVVVQRPRTDVVATNRALAVSTACTGCTSDAVAIQLVVQSRINRQVSADVRDMLQDLAEVLGTPVPAGPRLRETPHYHHGVHPAAFRASSEPAFSTAAFVAPAAAAEPAATGVAEAATATSPEQKALDAVVAQLTRDFGAGTVSVDVDVDR
jgi:hypothetical protein